MNSFFLDLEESLGSDNKFAKLNKLDFFYAQKLVIIKTIF
ncbi:hypothetical protein FN3523_0694 [Francisella hispaniensis]|uniref:Uncharacterized protein n=1 Tax=Francisella hispaniensis TaxID=622488 RepID=F4BK57_9GAMM|nr:hypothetical protein FN3523_0694 [Francisella hispaniensis]